MSRRLLAVVAAAALTVGLAACGDPSEGTKTDPPPSIDIEQSDGGGDGGASDGDEGSTEAAPDIPAPDPADYPGMDEQTPEGAEQAFKYFWDVLMVGYMTGDPGVLGDLSDPRCVNCETLKVEIEEIGRTGSHWSEATVEAVSLTSQDGDTDYEVIANYEFIVGEHFEPSSDAEDEGLVEESVVVSSGGLDWVDGRWLVVDFSSRVSVRSS